MSNAHRTDPYFRLLRIMIVLLVLFVVFLVGYLLLDSHLRGRYLQEQGRIVEEITPWCRPITTRCWPSAPRWNRT